jgi:hypothetical protein
VFLHFTKRDENGDDVSNEIYRYTADGPVSVASLPAINWGAHEIYNWLQGGPSPLLSGSPTFQATYRLVRLRGDEAVPLDMPANIGSPSRLGSAEGRLFFVAQTEQDLTLREVKCGDAPADRAGTKL